LTDRQTDATVKIADSALDLLFRSRRRHFNINFFGGEPLLNTDYIKHVVKSSIEHCGKIHKTCHFSITTNATLLNQEIIDFLVAHRFGVMVSLDGRETDNVLRVGAVEYRTLVKNIQSLLRAQRKADIQPLILRPTITKNHHGDKQVIVDYLLEKFRGARIGIGSSEPRLYTTTPLDIENRPDQYFQEIESLLSTFQQVLNGERITYNAARCLENLRDLWLKLDRNRLLLSEPWHYIPNICGVCRNSLSVGPEGDLYPCHRYYGMIKYKLGNVQNGEYEVKARQYYRKLLESRIYHCEKCWAQALCNGICIWRASKPDGTICPYPQEECDAIRKGFELLLIAYYNISRRFKPEQIRRVLDI